MTQKYLVAAFPNGRPPEIAPPLSRALARLGCIPRWTGRTLLLFAGEDLPLRELVNGRGFLLGHLFDRSGTVASRRLNADLFPSGAESIVREFWGAYVAFAEDEQALLALRDPLGGLPCYYAEQEGAYYFTSLPHLLIDCGLVTAEIDWNAISTSLARHAARTDETALRGIRELAPGTLLTVRRASSESRLVWNPWRFAERPLAAGAGERLEEVLSTTLGTWARSLKRPLIEISGGLDSAVVAAGIAPAVSDASLITFAAAPGDPDETLYARAIADRLGLPLEIATPEIGDVDLTRSLSSDLPRPNARAFTQAGDALSLRHARSIGADAFVSGGGGDDMFCYLRTILPAVDRLRAEGLRAMAGTARDIAAMNHSTLWQALSLIARRLFRGRSARPHLDMRFIAKAASLESLPLASLRPEASAAPGKADHVRGILTIHNYLEGHARAQFAPILSPLLSQPIAECCLAIPTWLWCEGGRNRAVARRAFERRLPPIVAERRSKGSFDGFCARLLHVNRLLVGEMLLDGHLAGSGLLDREAIASALRNPSPPADTVARLLALVDVESWVASWTSRERQRL